MLNFDPPVVKRSRWRRIRHRLGAVVRGGKRLDGFTKLVIVVVAAVLIPQIGSTFAGSITLNAGQAVEFGQGTVMTTACDESITITPTSRFSTADTAFYLGDITVSGIDEVECSADMFTITVFDQNGSPIDICEENSGDDWYTSPALQLAYQDSEESWVLISDCFFDQEPGGSVGSSTGFVFVPSENIDSSQVSSISIESALSTTADNWNQAVELNRSNTGTINVSTTNATLDEWEGFYEDEYESWSFSNTVWFAWTATQDGNLTIDTCNSNFDTVLQAFEWTPGTSIAANDDAYCGSEISFDVQSEISFDVQSGITYLIQLGGYEESSGLAQLNWSFEAGAITADDWNQAVELNRSNTGTINVSTTNATLEEWEGSYDGDFGSYYYGNTVWFKWTATQDGNLTINTCNSNFDTVLQAFEMPSGTSIAANDDAYCGSEISFDVQSGITYLIQLGGYEESSGLAQLNWSFEAGQISTTSTTSTTIEPSSCVGADTSTSGLDTILTFVSLASCDWIVPNGVTSVRYLVVGGGGAGDQGICNLVNPRAGGGGEVLTGTRLVTGGATVNITVGAGGTVGPKHMTYCDNSDPPLAISTSGSPSNFDSISADGGGTPDTTYTLSDLLLNKGGDSGNGHSGGNNSYNSCNNSPGSGGGAGGPGGNDCPNEYGTAGGIGVQSNITGATLGYGGGGGVEGWSQANGTVFPISVDGGSNGQSAARPHSGGGGVVAFPGGSGVVIVRFLTP